MKLKITGIIILASLAMSSCRSSDEDVYNTDSDNNIAQSYKKQTDTLVIDDSLNILNPKPSKPPIKGHHWRP